MVASVAKSPSINSVERSSSASASDAGRTPSRILSNSSGKNKNSINENHDGRYPAATSKNSAMLPFNLRNDPRPSAVAIRQQAGVFIVNLGLVAFYVLFSGFSGPILRVSRTQTQTLPWTRCSSCRLGCFFRLHDFQRFQARLAVDLHNRFSWQEIKQLLPAAVLQTIGSPFKMLAFEDQSADVLKVFDTLKVVVVRGGFCFIGPP